MLKQITAALVAVIALAACFGCMGLLEAGTLSAAAAMFGCVVCGIVVYGALEMI